MSDGEKEDGDEFSDEEDERIFTHFQTILKKHQKISPFLFEENHHFDPVDVIPNWSNSKIFEYLLAKPTDFDILGLKILFYTHTCSSVNNENENTRKQSDRYILFLEDLARPLFSFFVKHRSPLMGIFTLLSAILQVESMLKVHLFEVEVGNYSICKRKLMKCVTLLEKLLVNQITDIDVKMLKDDNFLKTCFDHFRRASKVDTMQDLINVYLSEVYFYLGDVFQREVVNLKKVLSDIPQVDFKSARANLFRKGLQYSNLCYLYCTKVGNENKHNLLYYPTAINQVFKCHYSTFLYDMATVVMVRCLKSLLCSNLNDGTINPKTSFFFDAGIFYQKLGYLEESASILRLVFEIEKMNYGKFSDNCYKTGSELSLMLHLLREYEESLPYFELKIETMALQKDIIKSEYMTFDFYGDSLYFCGQKQKAKEMWKKALNLLWTNDAHYKRIHRKVVTGMVTHPQKNLFKKTPMNFKKIDLEAVAKDMNYHINMKDEKSKRGLIKRVKDLISPESLNILQKNILNLNTCTVCGTFSIKLSRCAACKHAKYCSKKCQTKDWKTHRRYCKNFKALLKK